MQLSETLGFLAGAIGISSAIPQVVSIRRLGHANGVSLATWMMYYLYSSIWLGYGITTHSPSQMATNLLVMILDILIILAIMGRRVRNYLLLAFAPLATITVSMLIPSWLLSILLFGSSTATLGQVLASWKTLVNRKDSAVSTHMLLLSLTASALWLAYAILGSRTIVIVTTSISISTTMSILALEYLNGRNKLASSNKTDEAN